MSLPRYNSIASTGINWIGDIPAHWAVAPIKRLMQVVGGSTPNTENRDYWDGDVPWVTPADLSRLRGLLISQTLRSITIAGLASCGTTMVPAGSVILSTRAPIGSIGLAGTSLCTNQGCKSLVSRGQIDTKFVGYLLLSCTEVLNIRGKGTTFLELSGEELANFQIPIPTKSEQIAIVSFLDSETSKINALIDEQVRLIDLLNEKRQAVISHAVTKGLNPEAPMKDSGIEWLGMVPAHWQITSIGRLCDYLSYGFTNPMPTTEEGPFMLTANDIDYGAIRYETARRTSVEAYTTLLTNKSRPKAGDLLLTKDGTLGRVAIHDGRAACINQSVALLRPNSTMASEYFLAALMGGVYQNRMLYEAGGTTIKHIYISRLAKMPIAVPPLLEQRRIVEKLRTDLLAHAEWSTSAEMAITLLQERRSALISAAVTGKIDVRSSVNGETQADVVAV